MISALAWVPKGSAKELPEKVEPSEEELAAARAQEAAAAGNLDDSEEEGDEDVDVPDVDRKAALKAAAQLGKVADGMAELDMDNYDDEDDDEETAARIFAGAATASRVFENNSEDPYMEKGGESESDEEIEDFTFKKSDLLILAARTEDDVSTLEVWVYEERENQDDEANIYVHHDLMLPAFPLSLAWLNTYPSTERSDSGNLVAIGTFRPEIEIWDLDLLDAVEPAGLLGGMKEETAKAEKKKKKKKKKQPQLKDGSHSDAVLTLNWNQKHRNVLASGSADHTVKVWDITQQKCEHTLQHHTDKVQAVCWNPAQESVLLTGSFDKTAQLVDVRAPAKTISVKLTADVECCAWDLGNPERFLVSTEDGLVVCHDARMLASGGGNSAVYTLGAHDKAACALSFCPAAPQMLATASTDKTVKLWDTTSGSPKLLHKEDLGVGAVFAAGFCADSPFLISAAGSKGQVSVWDTLTVPSVVKKFGQNATPRGSNTESMNE